MSALVQIYSYSRCSTCRRALSWLEAHEIDYKLIDIVETPPSMEILKEALDQLAARKLLFNTSGLSYRTLGSKVVQAMSDQEALNALAADGKLIKRPFLITNQGKILVGFKSENWVDLLLN